MNSISVFETQLVILNPMLLIEHSGFKRYCWNPDGVDRGEPPINSNEIYLAINKNDLIPPDLFSDTPDNNQLCNITECSRREHVARIAWFVKNMSVDADNCIEVDFHKDSYDNSNFVSAIPSGGCHRLCAMIYLKMNRCVFKASSGSKPIVESSSAFCEWHQSIPSHNNPFGKNILSSEKGAWEIDLRLSDKNNQRIWVNDLSLMGGTIARFASFGKISSCEIYSNTDFSPSPFYKIGVSPKEFIVFCSERISPEFNLLADYL